MWSLHVAESNIFNQAGQRNWKTAVFWRKSQITIKITTGQERRLPKVKSIRIGMEKHARHIIYGIRIRMICQLMFTKWGWNYRDRIIENSHDSHDSDYHSLCSEESGQWFDYHGIAKSDITRQLPIRMKWSVIDYHRFMVAVKWLC